MKKPVKLQLSIVLKIFYKKDNLPPFIWGGFFRLTNIKETLDIFPLSKKSLIFLGGLLFGSKIFLEKFFCNAYFREGNSVGEICLFKGGVTFRVKNFDKKICKRSLL